MKQRCFIIYAAMLLLSVLISLPSLGQSGGAYLEGGTFVSAGGTNANYDGMIFEHSVGQVAYTNIESNTLLLEQGVLHNFVKEKDPSSPVNTTRHQTMVCNIYPNPCAAQLNVETLATGQNIHYKVMSATGTPFLQGVWTNQINILSTHTLPTGLYILILQGENGERAVKQFIKE